MSFSYYLFFLSLALIGVLAGILGNVSPVVTMLNALLALYWAYCIGRLDN